MYLIDPDLLRSTLTSSCTSLESSSPDPIARYAILLTSDGAVLSHSDDLDPQTASMTSGLVANIWAQNCGQPVLSGTNGSASGRALDAEAEVDEKAEADKKNRGSLKFVVMT